MCLVGKKTTGNSNWLRLNCWLFFDGVIVGLGIYIPIRSEIGSHSC